MKGDEFSTLERLSSEPGVLVGRPVLNSVSMHLHVEFLIMEAVFEHSERTLAEIVDNYVLYSTPQTERQYAMASRLYYLKRNRFSR